MESQREFELTKRNFISHFSIGSKEARDDKIFTWWETGNQYSKYGVHGGNVLGVSTNLSVYSRKK